MINYVLRVMVLVVKNMITNTYLSMKDQFNPEHKFTKTIV